MQIKKILIADDEPIIRSFLFEALSRKKVDITLAENGEVAIEELKKSPFDLIITDMKMPKNTGMDVLKFAKNIDRELPVIVMTAFGSIEDAVETIRLGALNYLIKPFSLEALEAMLHKVEEHLTLVRQNRYLREEISATKRSFLIAESPCMKKILFEVEKVAKSHASIFICGESGTGKEVIAQAIHQYSARSQHPFIRVNCAAIPETLVESEFFGYEKGAFTGANNKKEGRFEMANGGTLLLDEVTEIPLSLQPKLLRAIQEQEFERVGGTKSLHVDIRFIATSNRNMKEAIQQHIFREDLYYRLNVVPIYIPPLRQRVEDIIPLTNSFLEKFCRENHKPLKMLTPQAEKKLLSYPWPGNVRELANIIERTVVMDFAPQVDADHLYLDTSTKENLSSFEGLSLEEVEKRHILSTLQKENYNKDKTAQTLKIHLRTLRNKLQQWEKEKICQGSLFNS